MQYIVKDNKQSIANELAYRVIDLIKENKGSVTNIALSGGSTPFIMFEVWADEFSETIDWSLVHFYWVDERCVPPTSDECNYKNTKSSLFDRINIPKENIHRVFGEDAPSKEALRYGQLIVENVPSSNNLPSFDIVLLGMGDDGHTASIFPHQMNLLSNDAVVVEAQNPYSLQHRISLSGPVINNAKHIMFLVTGSNKAVIVDEIFSSKGDFKQYPSAHISEDAIWYLDQDASVLLNK